MVFGRFGGDKKLEAQKALLGGCVRQLEAIEQKVRDIAPIEAQFADVWPAEGVPPDILSKLGKARELTDLLVQRANAARRELENFDEAVAFLSEQLPRLEQSWTVFMAMLLARQTILSGDSAEVPATDQPTMRQCQLALMGIAEGLYGDLKRHIDELGPIKAKFDGPWPELLDLPAMEKGIDDVRGALNVYRERLDAGNAELPEVSTASLMGIIGMMQNSILKIEDARVDLATHIVMKSAMKNSGLS